MRALPFLLVSGLCAALPAPSSAQERFPFFPGGTYDASVPSPEAHLGYPLGSRYTEHWRIRPYLEALAKTSPRISWSSYGKTAERRPLLLAAVTSAQNRARLEEIRAGLAQLGDPRSLTEEQAREKIAEKFPAVVWLSFNVHGNEASGTEAALALLYQLCAGTDARTLAILQNTVALIDPCLNPDGRDRFVNWFQSVVGDRPNPDPKSFEHAEPWPGGRGNHFGFDLNRDWAFLSQPESRARVAAYLSWSPQVHVDFHEMDPESSYFFFPADVPINLNLPPSTLEWQKVFGRGNAAAFDKFGWLYYTGERFDLFYPGYGDSWPSLQGAVGMTYEQAGHSAAGIAIRRRDESILTLHDRAWHHFSAAVATLETAAANRRDLLLDYYRFFRSAVEDAKDQKLQCYLLAEGSDPARAAALADVLIAQGVEVHRAKEAFLAGPIGKFGGGSVEKEKFAAGTYLVRLSQPRRRLANALLEPEPAALDLYFYDVSAWSLPLAFGVEAYWCDAPVEARAELLTAAPPPPTPSLIKASYAYLIPWDSGGAPALTHHLLKDGFIVRLARKDFRIARKDYPKGTAVVPVAGNPESLHERIAGLAGAWKVPVRSVETGLAERGMDLGSDRALTLRPRRIAVATGSGVSPTSYGAIHFLLERQHNMEFSSLSLEAIGREELASYHVLVLPDGSGYGEKLDKERAKRIERWIQGGGTLVAIGGGAAWATASRSGLTKVELASTAAASPAGGPKAWVRMEEAESERRRRDIPGTILAVQLDPDHPIAFGYGEGPVYVMQQSGRAFNLPDEGRAVGVYSDAPKVAGYLSREDQGQFHGKAYLVQVSSGEGRVVLFADDPNFRLMWQGLTKLFLNAVLLPH